MIYSTTIRVWNLYVFVGYSVKKTPWFLSILKLRSDYIWEFVPWDFNRNIQKAAIKDKSIKNSNILK